VLTSAEAAAAAADISAFQAFLADHSNPHAILGHAFTFSSLGLKVSGIERLEIVSIGGNTAPLVTPNTSSVEEDGPAFSFDLLTGATDSDGPSALSAQSLASSVTGSLGRTLSLGTHYTQSGSTLALTAAGFAALNSLAEGESEQFTFNYQVSDGAAATADSLTLTVTGANDQVTITSGAQSGNVVEDETPAATGTIDFGDVDLSDGHTASFVRNNPEARLFGTFSLDPLSEAPHADSGSVTWHFNLDPGVQSLAEGQTRTDSYTVFVDDGHGSEASQEVSITFTGTNDPVVITSGAQSGSVEEDATLQASGMFVFEDVDLTDVHTPAFVVSPLNTTALGTFSLDTLNQGTGGGTLTWHYTLNNAAAQALEAGEVATENYFVTISDGLGSVSVDTVVITITGTNDEVFITSGAQSGAVVEDGTLTADGSIEFSDADVSDLHTASITSQPATPLGSFQLDTVDEAVGATSGTVTWHYDLDNTAAQALAAGQVVTETYTVMVGDGHGSTATQDVVITITGAGDNTAPTVTNVSATASTLSFIANDADNATLSLTSPFAVAFGDPAITTGIVTTLIPVEQAAAVSGMLQLTDGAHSADVIGLFLGTGAGDIEDRSASTTPVALYGFGGADTLIGGTGNDTLVGAQNDTLLDGGGGTDTLNIGTNWIGSVDAQIVNIENVTLTSAVQLNLFSQTEGFTITGSAGADLIVGSAGADTIIGAQNDIQLIGGPGTDTLSIGADFTSSSDSQIQQIENVVLTSAVQLNLANQSEAFRIFGSTGDDTFTGKQNDTLLDGGGGTDTLNIGTNWIGSVDAQIVNIENVTLTSAVQLNLFSQTEGFTITGSAGADLIVGSAGADTIIGAQNDIQLIGAGGVDTLSIGANFTSSSDSQIQQIENVVLTSAATLNLANQSEGFSITGSAGADTIIGGLGADTITGGAGNDTMSGGSGNDSFRFATTLNAATNVDQITDFIVADDTIVLDNAVFTALTATGTLATENFAVGAAAADADDFIIYDDASGALFYDADGSGLGDAQVQFATLNPGLAIANDDFLVV
jgi:VCBS repeat-containing protein